MHLCIDARLIYASGIGRFLRPILEECASCKKLSLTLLGWQKDCTALLKFSPAQVIFIKSPIYSFFEQVELPWFIPPCDVFWSPHFNVPALGVRAKKRVVTIHDTYHLSFLSTFSMWKKMYAKVVYKMACQRSITITTISSFSKSEIVRHGLAKPEKIRVIPLGVDRNLSSQKKDQLQIKMKYHLPDRFILSVTNLKPHKNFERMYCACEMLLPLVVVGPKCTQKNVISVGHIPDTDLATLYSMAQLFVFPSLYEGFGLPPLEAMSCGCPVIVSQSAALPETCGDAAFYVNAYDVNSIRNGIAMLLDNQKLRGDLIEKGRQHVRKRTLQDAAKDYLNLFLSLR